MTQNKGGYHARGRLEATLDEIKMEAQAAATGPAHNWQKAFEEIGRLTAVATGLLDYIQGQPPLGGLAPA